jgi:hypothetical protein
MVKANKSNKPYVAPPVIVESYSETDSSDSSYSECVEPIPVKTRKPRKKIVNEFTQKPKVNRKKTPIPDVLESNVAKPVPESNVAKPVPIVRKRAPSAYNAYVKLKMADTDIKILAPKLRFAAISKAYKYDKEHGNL